MNKKIRVLAVATAMACLAAVPCVAFGAETGKAETGTTASTQSTQMAYSLKAYAFSKSGVVINDNYEFERIRMGHQGIGISVVKVGDDKDKLQDISKFDYSFTIDGLSYPKVLKVDTKNNIFVLNLPYGVAGKAKLEVVNKSDKSAKGVLEFGIDNNKFYGYGPEASALTPYDLRDRNMLWESERNLPFTYNRETGEYTITLPDNPLPAQVREFPGWKVTVGNNPGKVYKVNEKVVVNGKCVIEPAIQELPGRWGEKYNQWVYYDAGGSLVKNTMKTINGNQYYFDEYGIMATGWRNFDGTWYYFNKKGEGTEGAMVADKWKKISGKWYYFYKDGKMASDTKVGNYYVNRSGAWSYDHWIKSNNGKWWYAYEKGGYAKDGIVTIGGKQYFFDKAGWMVTGWHYDKGTWYYFNKKGQGTEGAMAVNTWKKVNGNWYYFYKDGKMAANTMIGKYYVNGSGAWRWDHWVKNGNGKWWYYYKEGGYPENTITKIGGNKYAFDKAGWMLTGWHYDKGTWYYFNKKGQGTEGAMATNTWKKVNGKWYYFYENGKMAANTVIAGYKVDKTGAWVK